MSGLAYNGYIPVSVAGRGAKFLKPEYLVNSMLLTPSEARITGLRTCVYAYTLPHCFHRPLSPASAPHVQNKNQGFPNADRPRACYSVLLFRTGH